MARVGPQCHEREEENKSTFQSVSNFDDDDDDDDDDLITLTSNYRDHD